MKITVINGTEKKGVTYNLKEAFLEPFRDKAQITEYYLPKDCPDFCAGCATCFLKDEKMCKDAQYTQKIEESLLEADLLVFATPVYVYHASGAMKNMLDHFGYRWMVHRPAKEMFKKRAVIITQCIGAGDKSTAKDIRDSLSWWGISSIKEYRFKLMNGIFWDELPEKKRTGMTKKLRKAAFEILGTDFNNYHTSIKVKCRFLMVRMIQKSVGKQNPDSADYIYWKENDWIGKARPWK